MEAYSLEEVVKEAALKKNLTIKKLAELNDIQERYLIAILDLDENSVPPPPFIRGYLKKLAESLDLDGNELWRLYKKEAGLGSHAGAIDELPQNRYSASGANKKWLLYSLPAIIIFLYLTWNIKSLLSAPEINITYPNVDELIVSQPNFNITGSLDPNYKLTINDKNVLVDSDGRFNFGIDLKTGLNLVDIKAKKFLGKETKVQKRLIYEPPSIETGNEITPTKDEVSNPKTKPVNASEN